MASGGTLNFSPRMSKTPSLRMKRMRWYRPFSGFASGCLGGLFTGRESQLFAAAQRSQRCPASKGTVAIGAIVSIFKLEAFLVELWRGIHYNSVQELVAPVVIEFFNHPVAPGLCGRDEPDFYPM